jgi:hypothetical protein
MKAKNTYLKKVCTILAISGTALGAQAISTPIDGYISFSGSSTIDGTDFVTSTQFLSFDNVFVGSPATVSGDYLGTSGEAVDVTPWTWAPTTASTPINPLWSFMSGGITYAFDLSVMHEDYVSPTGLVLSGFGTAHITGAGVEKLDTSGRWNFSAQTLGESSFTFSSTTRAASVPEGGSTAVMLGGVVCCLGMISRKLKAS